MISGLEEYKDIKNPVQSRHQPFFCSQQQLILNSLWFFFSLSPLPHTNFPYLFIHIIRPMSQDINCLLGLCWWWWRKICRAEATASTFILNFRFLNMVLTLTHYLTDIWYYVTSIGKLKTRSTNLALATISFIRAATAIITLATNNRKNFFFFFLNGKIFELSLEMLEHDISPMHFNRSPCAKIKTFLSFWEFCTNPSSSLHFNANAGSVFSFLKIKIKRKATTITTNFYEDTNVRCVKEQATFSSWT